MSLSREEEKRKSFKTGISITFMLVFIHVSHLAPTFSFFSVNLHTPIPEVLKVRSTVHYNFYANIIVQMEAWGKR